MALTLEGYDGKDIAPGDYVELSVDHISKDGRRIKCGSKRRVQSFNGELTHVALFIDSNDKNHPWVCTWVPLSIVRRTGKQRHRFTRYREVTMEKDTEMLYVAIKLPNNEIAVNYQIISDHINNTWQSNGTSDTFGPSMMSDTNESALKEKVRQDIARNPDNRWLMLHGNILARAEHPPVRFSQW